VKLINNRLYFDYNATSPLAKSVKDLLARGDFPFNSSSIHTSGKNSRREILNSITSIQKVFHTSYLPIFHSGATEGINLCLQGRVRKILSEGKLPFLIALSTDHSAVLNTIKSFKDVPFEILSVDKNGNPNLNELQEILSANKQHEFVVNLTWINNETGIVLEIDNLISIFKPFSAFLHLDSAQAPNKIKNWFNLPAGLDAYTFSSHKFGGLTGCGFSFLKDEKSILPIIYGGGQQSGLRGGTENALGIISTSLALEEIALFEPKLQEVPKNIIESQLLKELGDRIIIVGQGSIRNLNTINLIWKPQPSDQILVHFDLAQMDISAGSACSSGRLKGSHVLKAMGYETYSHHGLRFSFSPQMTQSDAVLWGDKIVSLFQSL
jgi:cysteine desulfurase